MISAPNLLYNLNPLTLRLEKRPDPTLHRILMTDLTPLSLPLRPGGGTNLLHSQEVVDFLTEDPPVHTLSLENQINRSFAPQATL